MRIARIFKYGATAAVCLSVIFLTWAWSLPYLYHQTSRDHSTQKLTWPTSAKSPEPRAREQRRVAYVKVHRTGSTTLLGIFQRFGFNRNLTFAMPRDGRWHLGLFHTIDAKMIAPIAPGRTYDILCQHVVYNKTVFDNYLPSDSLYVASVREPFSRFISAFTFFYLGPMARKTGNVSKSVSYYMKEYLKDPQRYEIYRNGSIALNRMSFDLGVPQKELNNLSYISNYLKSSEDDFEVVLIREYFDESLVLMRRKLFWKLKDILYLSKHVHHHESSISISQDVKDLHRDLAKADYKVYDMFYSRFWRQIRQEPVDFFDEVRAFKETREEANRFCFSEYDKERSTKFERTQWSEEFVLSDDDCYYLGLPELKFNKLIMDREHTRMH